MMSSGTVVIAVRGTARSEENSQPVAWVPADVWLTVFRGHFGIFRDRLTGRIWGYEARTSEFSSGTAVADGSGQGIGHGPRRVRLARLETAALRRLNARARPVEGHARGLVEPPLVEALDHRKDLAR
jgi:hypothetical protein